MKDVSDLKADVSAILTGLDLDQVPNLNESLERAVSTFIQKADVLEATAEESLLVYNGVYDYTSPERIFGAGIIDMAPQGVVRQPWDYTYKTGISQFDRTKGYQYNGYTLNFLFRNGQAIMRVATPNTTPMILLDPMNSTTGWTAAGTASGLAQDITVFYQQPASLRFLLGTGVGTLTKTLTNPLNLSIYQGVGVAFLAIMIPAGTDPTTLTSIALRIGSDSTNYTEITQTEGFLGSWIAGNFLLVAFDTALGTTTGTPNWSAIDYVQVLLTASGNIINMRAGYLFIALPSATNILYYSPAVFQAGTATPTTTITTDNDNILFRHAAYNIYVQEAAREIAKDQGGNIGSAVIAGIDLVLEGNNAGKTGLYQQFRGDNGSEEIRQVGSYYEAGQGSGGQ